jgi:hypothetical protein
VLAEPFQATIGYDDPGHGFHARGPFVKKSRCERRDKKRTPVGKDRGEQKNGGSFSRQTMRLANLSADYDAQKIVWHLIACQSSSGYLQVS